jgi:flagellum-specific ATP synthase
MAVLDLSPYLGAIVEAPLLRRRGRVVQVIGLSIVAEGLPVQLGEICHIYPTEGQRISAEVVGFRDDRVILMPFSEMHGVRRVARSIAAVACSRCLAGKCFWAA